MLRCRFLFSVPLYPRLIEVFHDFVYSFVSLETFSSPRVSTLDVLTVTVPILVVPLSLYWYLAFAALPRESTLLTDIVWLSSDQVLRT